MKSDLKTDCRINKIEKKVFEIYNCIKKNKYDNNLDLANGISGDILFQYHFNQKFKTNNNHLFNSLEKLYSTLPYTHIGSSYINGLSGVFYLLNYLYEKGIVDKGYKEAELMLNEVLKRNLLENINKLNFDFLHGASGVLKYLLKCENNTEFLNLIIQLYSEKIIKSNDGMSFFPSYNFILDKPENDLNLSLSHGNSAIICILLEMYIVTNNEKIKKIVKQILDSYLILKNKKNKRSLSLYPNSNNDLRDSRLAWCYGDLGVANSFWQAGKVLNIPEWKIEAVNIMLSCSKRKDLNENKVVDAGICHGTAGIAHMFNRFYKETKIIEFDLARWYWLDKTLKMANFKDGLAGYKTYFMGLGWKNDYSFIEGISGIGLVLLGFLTNEKKDLSWDKFILLS